MNALDRYEQWCTSPVFDAETKKELEAIRDNKDEINDRFYKELEFGTGGLRGVIGAGTNRMNIYTVGKATQGLADYILKQGGSDKGVALAYDSRHMSPEFAKYAALCLNANGIKTYLFDQLAPTPMLSFAVRRLSCIAGIVITASHNPAEYNGYKVYWEDGAQITFPMDKEIIACVNAIDDYAAVKSTSEQEAVDKGLFHLIGEEMEEEYRKELKKMVLSEKELKEAADKIKIVYSPLHGTGNLPVQHILAELGFTNVFVVKEQMEPNGDFPTVSYPNPEDTGAFKLALQLAKEKDADLVLATDPDADRLGVYGKDPKTGEYRMFTGNMSGILILNYLLSRRQELGVLPKNGAVVKTIVTTKMAEPVAAHYNMKLIDVLTGFKYIGEQMKYFEETGDFIYQFGFEESYGCLVEEGVRDKDAVSAVMTLCEAAVYYYTKGSSLSEEMDRLYETYGYYKEDLASVTLKGEDGANKIKAMMEEMRSNPPKSAGGFPVLQMEDYLAETTGLPKSNVLRFALAEDAWFCVRPSGTEPKIKFYFGVKGSSEKDAEERLERLKKEVLAYGTN